MALSIPDASGVLIKPARPGASPGRAAARGETSGKKIAFSVLGAAAIIGAAGAGGLWWSMRAGGGGPPGVAAAAVPSRDPDRAKLETELADARAALATEKAAADELRKREKAKADEATALQEKLALVVKGTGEVTQNGNEIHLQLVDKVLFRVGEAELTATGAAVLAKVGIALNDIPDKQIWVQGHTDDTPIRAPRPAPATKATKAAKATKGAKPPVVEDAPRFPSNWELSSARALTVVHYLQDQSKVDPHRLAAVAFSEYRPASRAKAKNRRIEIVLYPKHQLAKD